MRDLFCVVSLQITVSKNAWSIYVAFPESHRVNVFTEHGIRAETETERIWETGECFEKIKDWN